MNNLHPKSHIDLFATANVKHNTNVPRDIMHWRLYYCYLFTHDMWVIVPLISTQLYIHEASYRQKIWEKQKKDGYEKKRKEKRKDPDIHTRPRTKKWNTDECVPASALPFSFPCSTFHFLFRKVYFWFYIIKSKTTLLTLYFQIKTELLNVTHMMVMWCYSHDGEK